MTTAAAIRADQRADTRRRMREAMLSAAHGLAVARGWGAVRMGEVAQHVGVSRQTLYAEFGSKEALGQALVLRDRPIPARSRRGPSNVAEETCLVRSATRSDTPGGCA